MPGDLPDPAIGVFPADRNRVDDERNVVLRLQVLDEIVVVRSANAYIERRFERVLKILRLRVARYERDVQAESLEKPPELNLVRAAHRADVEDVHVPAPPVCGAPLVHVGLAEVHATVRALHVVLEDAVIHCVVCGRHKLRLEALAKYRDEDRGGLPLEIGENAVDVVSDQSGHASVRDDDSFRAKLTIRVEYGLAKLFLASRDYVRLVKVRAEPNEAL